MNSPTGGDGDVSVPANTRVFLRTDIALKKSCHHPGQRTPAT
jgi:hypothetical protein